MESSMMAEPLVENQTDECYWQYLIKIADEWAEAERKIESEDKQHT